VSRKKKKQVRAPDLVHRLSKSPNGSWGQRTLYHGSRIALLVLLAAGITFLFPPDTGRPVPLYSYQEGDLAQENVTAEVPFEVPKDPLEIERLLAEAAAAVPPVFEYDDGTQERIEESLNAFFDSIQAAVQAGGPPQVEAVLREVGLESLVDAAENFLDPTELRALRRATLTVVREWVDRFLYSDFGDEALSAGRIQVVPLGDTEYFLDADTMVWGRDFYTAAIETLDPSTAQFQSIVRVLLRHFFESPYTYDPVRSEVLLARERSAVQTIERNVVPGEIIVRDGDRIGPLQIRSLNAYREALESQGLLQDVGLNWPSILGRLLINTLLLGIFGGLLFFYRREVYGSFRWLFLLVFLLSVYFLVAAGISWQGLPWELLPAAFVVLPVAILWDGRMALILALVLGLLSSAQTPFNSSAILAFTVVGGAAAALSARAVRRRSQTWIFIALITLAYALSIAAYGLMGELGQRGVLVSLLYAGLNATVSAILAMGFMPVFEWFTGITTDQTLLEWADPNRPLLKSLSLEASGTYAHTISVANLAEAAATAIGANGLLTRVGIYYHDVGKMLKPQYFVENQPEGRNPHDKLKPQTSATIVKEHVIAGEKMARDEGVPDIVARFIPEHHGTQLIGFFYEKAREESEEEPDPEEFRYPGPKPRSKETAIAMLADSVESATRVLQDPSPERVQELVKTIVNGKVQDGQLSDAPLTLRELTLIQEQFVKVVSGMFHHRLDYPATRHLTETRNGEREEPGPEVAPRPPEASRELPMEPSGPSEAVGPEVDHLEEDQLPLTPAPEGPGAKRGDGE
jgi:putative nucleotidyltransferase with HDIG domain